MIIFSRITGYALLFMDKFSILLSIVFAVSNLSRCIGKICKLPQDEKYGSGT
jgi:hypothetical protein